MDNITCAECGTKNDASLKYCKYCGYELPKPKIDMEESPIPQPAPAKQKRNMVWLGIIAGAIVLGMASWAVQKVLIKPYFLEKALREIASEVNKTCPAMVDQITRIDSVVALHPNAIQYNYTLVNLSKIEVNLDTLKKYIEPNAIHNARTNPQMKFFRDNKTTIIYNYHDTLGKFVYTFSLTPDRYQ